MSGARVTAAGWDSWLDASGRAVWISEAVHACTGQRGEDLLRVTDYPLRLFTEASRADLERALAAVARDGTAGTVEAWLLRPGRNPARATVQLHRVVDRDAAVQGILLLVRLGRPDEAQFLRQVID